MALRTAGLVSESMGLAAPEWRCADQGLDEGMGWRHPIRKLQNQAQALKLLPASLATGPGPNFWTKTRIGVTRAAG